MFNHFRIYANKLLGINNFNETVGFFFFFSMQTEFSSKRKTEKVRPTQKKINTTATSNKPVSIIYNWCTCFGKNQQILSSSFLFFFFF